jgi:hypothetical protein
LSLRGGIVASQIATFSFGLGVNQQSLKIDFATTYHQVLGFTPALSLSYSILKKTEKK